MPILLGHRANVAAQKDPPTTTDGPEPLRLGVICAVTAAAETLLVQALTLPVEDRLLLASGLLASLDSHSVENAEVDRLWSAETERRATLLASGEAALVTWDVQRACYR